MIFLATSNQNKIFNAHRALDKYSIEFAPTKLTLVEIQAQSIEEISKSKAAQAFEQLQQPVLVEDSGWHITALKGFPAAYMADMNKWLTAEDFLKLMENKEDKEVILRQVVTYKVQNILHSIKCDTTGTFLTTAYPSGIASDQVISLRKDLKSMAECKEKDIEITENMDVWEKVAQWYLEYIKV